jgi:hypothetical protein
MNHSRAMASKLDNLADMTGIRSETQLSEVFADHAARHPPSHVRMGTNNLFINDFALQHLLLSSRSPQHQERRLPIS